MSVTYTAVGIAARLQAIATLLNGGQFVLLAGSTVICSINMANPSGIVAGGILTITLPLLGVASAAGIVTSVSLRDVTAVDIVSDLSVGIPLSGADVIIANGINSTFINVGQSVQVLGAQITGS